MSLKLFIKSIASSVGVMFRTLVFRISTIYNSFDRRDLFFFGGLAMLFHGLSIYSSSVAYSVCGGILIAVSLIGIIFVSK